MASAWASPGRRAAATRPCTPALSTSASRAVVPVCSVGNYQVYLQTACCVCEVLPGALRFTEEGEVLGLVAPRSLLVINATMDGIQFSVGEAKKSLAMARAIFKLYGKDNLAHATFESPHAYNQAMRETMYGWMTRWLKNEGDGKPIPEPKHEVEKEEDLSCFAEGEAAGGFPVPGHVRGAGGGQAAETLPHDSGAQGRLGSGGHAEPGSACARPWAKIPGK